MLQSFALTRYLLIFLLTSSTERKQAISQAIDEVKASFKAKEEAKKNRVLSQNEKDGKYTSSQLLAKFFKKPSEKAVKIGMAQLKYEEMVRTAERKLSEIKRKSKANSQSVAAKAEALAEELFHKPGTLLKSEEIAHMWQESGCQDLREPPNCFFPTVNQFRTIDGTCNNLENPLFGASGTNFRRLIPGQYEDGISSLRGQLQQSERAAAVLGIGPFLPPNPSARLISSTVVRNISQDEIPFTHILMQWGQFLDHDLDLGPELEEECEGCTETEICAPIPVPDGDETFGLGTPNDGDCLPLRRSLPSCPVDRPLSFSPREQINDLTSFIDGSMVYGSNEMVGSAVRESRDGLLRTGPNFPGNQPSLPVDTEKIVACPNRMDCFLCGDVRCNEQVSLTIMHTIWLREHNRCARELGRINPQWGDERLFQECRRIVGALIQKITYEDYLPKVLGPKAFDIFIGPYPGYDPEVDPGVPNSFATAAYRYGHSLIRPQFDRLDANFSPLGIGPLNLVDAFFNPDQFRISMGTDPIARGWVSVNSRRMDEFMNSVLTNQLFQTSISPGMDLASLNLQRGRGHGLPPYPIWRNFCNRIFGITSQFENELTLVRFLQVYGSIDTLDLWIGGLAEERLPESLLGATFNCLFGLTFNAVRNGDRFYYEKPGVFPPNQLAEIRKHTLSRVLCDNGDNINAIQPDAFLSNQTRVRCSQIPGLDFNQFREDVCFFRLRMRPRNFDALVDDFSRSIQSNFIFSSVLVPSSTQNQFVCVQIQCPTSSVPTDVIIYSPDGLTVTPDSTLPASSLEFPTAYRAFWPRSQFSAGQGGVFFNRQDCERSSQFAINMRPPRTDVAAELEALQKAKASQDGSNHDHDKNDQTIPEYLRKVVNSENPNAKVQEVANKKVKTEKAKAEASDNMLLKELETALKDLQ